MEKDSLENNVKINILYSFLESISDLNKSRQHTCQLHASLIPSYQMVLILQLTAVIPYWKDNLGTWFVLILWKLLDCAVKRRKYLQKYFSAQITLKDVSANIQQSERTAWIFCSKIWKQYCNLFMRIKILLWKNVIGYGERNIFHLINWNSALIFEKVQSLKSWAENKKQIDWQPTVLDKMIKFLC